ncbi:unnamed protein product [Sphagnum balticum]
MGMRCDGGGICMGRNALRGVRGKQSKQCPRRAANGKCCAGRIDGPNNLAPRLNSRTPPIALPSGRDRAILDVIPIASRGVFFFLQIDFLDQRSSSAIWVRWVLWFCREGRTSFSSFASCFLLQQQEAAEICTDRKKQRLLQNWIDCRETERERERTGRVLCFL